MSDKKINSCKSFTSPWTFSDGADKLVVQPAAKDNFAARFSQYAQLYESILCHAQ